TERKSRCLFYLTPRFQTSRRHHRLPRQSSLPVTLRPGGGISPKRSQAFLNWSRCSEVADSFARTSRSKWVNESRRFILRTSSWPNGTGLRNYIIVLSTFMRRCLKTAWKVRLTFLIGLPCLPENKL